MILLIDNYDSFTFNLLQYLGEVHEDAEIKVVRNDEISITEIQKLAPKHIVISPGPCTPNEAGISVELVQKLSGTVPILGVCLGHQAIGQAFGGIVVQARRIFHGKTSTINHTDTAIFANIPQGFTATRYHSLLVEAASLPSCLEILAWTSDDTQEIMAFRHREHPSTIGVQFHPESILTAEGKSLLSNFLSIGASEHSSNDPDR